METEIINQSESVVETESIELQREWRAGPLEGDEPLRGEEVKKIDSRMTLVGWNAAIKETLPGLITSIDSGT